MTRLTALCLIVPLLAAGACSVQTDVSATGATAPSVSHLYLTVESIQLNASSTATPRDQGWVTASLPSPQVIDLAPLNTGSTQVLIKALSLPAGDYAQLQLVLADSSATLTSAAQAAGLTSNAEVQYVDAAGVAQTRNIELSSPTSSVLIPVTLVLKSPSAGAFFAGNASSGTGSAGAGGTATTPSSTIAIDLDTVRTLLPLAGPGDTGALLTPGLAAHDTSTVGGLQGSLDLSALPVGTATGYQGLVATAEALSADGTRFVAVKSAPVQASGSFALYPLAAATNGATAYDLVIHGQGVQTVLVSAVPVTAGATQVTTLPAIHLVPAASFAVNANGVVTTGGTQLDFYQTVPGQTIPHLIEFAVLSPFTQRFPVDIRLSAADIVYGAYSASGLSFTAGAPTEGAGTYAVTGEAPLRASSTFGEFVSAPSGSSGATIAVTPPALALPSGATAATFSGTVTIGTPSRYDSLFVLVSRGGQLIDAIDLSASLRTPGTIGFNVANLPAGVPTAVYDVAARAWNSANPSATLVRAAAPAEVDLRQGSAASVSLQLP